MTAAGYTASMGHTDPGDGFPMDVFLAATGAPIVPPSQEIEDMLIQAPANQQHNPNAPAFVSLDMANKKVNPLNGAHFVQSPNIPEPNNVIGWYEQFFPDGVTKRGFVVLGSKNAVGINPAYTFTWA